MSALKGQRVERIPNYFGPTRQGRVIHRLTSDNGASEKVIYSSRAPDSYASCIRCLACMSCDCYLYGHAQQIQDSTYVTVYENKLEINKPWVNYCVHVDGIETLYFDRDVFEMTAAKAGCCSPSGTHGSCCPTCCDACGEGLVLHGPKSCVCCECIQCTCGCCFNCGCGELPIYSRDAGLLSFDSGVATSCCGCCAKNFHLLWPVFNAKALSQAVNDAKEKSRAVWKTREDKYLHELAPPEDIVMKR